MKPVAFDYCRPDTVEEALDVLAEYGSDAAVLAGGMSLGPMLNMRLVRPTVVLDIHRLSGLQGLTVNGALRIGAAARQVDVMRDGFATEAAPLLARALPHVGHYQTRNRGTFGGSVAHADPSAEIPLSLLALGGLIELRSKRKTRTVPAADFFKGVLTTEKQPDELITGLDFPTAAPGAGHGFAEFAQRHGDFALAAAAATVTLDGSGNIAALRLGYGGVEDRPVLADTAQWAGQTASEDLTRDIAATTSASLDAAEDATASADYRRALAAEMAARALTDACSEARP